MVADQGSNSAAMLFDRFNEIKKAQRDELEALSPDDAQAVVEGILHPRLWRVENPRQLAWPGDWADDEKGG